MFKVDWLELSSVGPDTSSFESLALCVLSHPAAGIPHKRGRDGFCEAGTVSLSILQF